MNTHAEYHRHGYQPPESPPPAPPDPEVSEFARHRDPSLGAPGRAPSSPQKRVAWVRPTELASYVGPTVGRGIDLHAELVRRARRAPITAARTVQSQAPTTTPPPTANHTEGLQL